MQQAKPEQSKPKRLLVVSQHFWPENFRISDIVEGFVEDNIEVDVLCGLPNYPSGEWFEGYKYKGPRREVYKGAHVFRSGEIRRKGNTTLRIFLNFVSFPLLALFNLPRLAGRKYDAVFCYETAPVLMMLPAIVYAKLHKIPLTTYVLDLWPDNLYSALSVESSFWRDVVQKISDWHYRRSPRLIGMSDELGKRLVSLYGAWKKPIEVSVIPQYCEDFYAEDVDDPGLKDRFAGKFNILFAGNISPLQDLENLVEAMKIVAETNASAIRCLIVGDGMSRNSLEALVKEEGLEEQFVFCGSCAAKDIPRWTGMADALFAGLAKAENLGLTVPAKITSYFAAGRPMLVAAEGEAQRVPKESGAALVSPAGDAQALAKNILALHALPIEERKRMGLFGRQYYQENFRRDVLLERLKQVILEP